ncbi:hypothetical protein ACS0TY_028248 [Phlomoides rotata]
MLLHFGNKPVIIVQSTDAAHEIMKTNDVIFVDRAYTKTFMRLLYDLNGVISAPYGEYLRKLRSICVLQLLTGKKVQAAFGRKYSEREDGKKFLMLHRELVHQLASYSIGKFVPCLSWINRVNGFNNVVYKIVNEVDDFLERVIQQQLDKGQEFNDAIKNGRRVNFVDILLNVYNDNPTYVSLINLVSKHLFW